MNLFGLVGFIVCVGIINIDDTALAIGQTPDSLTEMKERIRDTLIDLDTCVERNQENTDCLQNLGDSLSSMQSVLEKLKFIHKTVRITKVALDAYSKVFTSNNAVKIILNQAMSFLSKIKDHSELLMDFIVNPTIHHLPETSKKIFSAKKLSSDIKRTCGNHRDILAEYQEDCPEDSQKECVLPTDGKCLLDYMFAVRNMLKDINIVADSDTRVCADKRRIIDAFAAPGYIPLYMTNFVEYLDRILKPLLDSVHDALDYNVCLGKYLDEIGMRFDQFSRYALRTLSRTKQKGELEANPVHQTERQTSIQVYQDYYCFTGYDVLESISNIVSIIQNPLFQALPETLRGKLQDVKEHLFNLGKEFVEKKLMDKLPELLTFLNLDPASNLLYTDLSTNWTHYDSLSSVRWSCTDRH